MVHSCRSLLPLPNLRSTIMSRFLALRGSSVLDQNLRDLLVDPMILKEATSSMQGIATVWVLGAVVALNASKIPAPGT